MMGTVHSTVAEVAPVFLLLRFIGAMGSVGPVEKIKKTLLVVFLTSAHMVFNAEGLAGIELHYGA